MTQQPGPTSDTGRTVLDDGPGRTVPNDVLPLWPRWQFAGRSFAPLPFKVAMTAVALGVLLWLPQYYTKTTVERFTDILCLAIAAAGLNLLTGISGQISVGHGAFYALGAYTSLLLVIERQWPFWLAGLTAAAVSFVVGLLVGIPALRIRGLYLAIATLALAVLTPQVIIRFSSLTGGTQGRAVSKQKTPEVFGFNRPPADSGLAVDQYRYYVVLVVAVIAFALVRNLVRSRVGRALIATRDNETAAEVVGVPLAQYKVLTFGVSAMLAGVGGAMSAFSAGRLSANSFGIDLSIELLVAVVIGGAATIVGPAIGALLLVQLPEWLPDDRPQLAPVLFGLSLVLLMRVAPGGVIGGVRRLGAVVRRRFDRPAASSDSSAGASPGSTPPVPPPAAATA